MHSHYDDLDRSAAAARDGGHREAVGGLWEELGALQLNFLIDQGLRPAHRLLDIGCGSLRLGVRAIPYLDSGRYFGTDISGTLLDLGWRVELDDAGRARTPRQHLHVSPDFQFDFLPGPMDFGIAQSVFTHLPFNHMRRCLLNAAPHFRPGGRLFFTAFIRDPSDDLAAPQTSARGDIVTFDWRDPYHYWPDDFSHACAHAPWSATVLGDWGHPRGQAMVMFERR